MQKKLSFHQFTNRRSKWKLTDEFFSQKDYWGLNISLEQPLNKKFWENLLKGNTVCLRVLIKYFHYLHTLCYPSEYIPSKRIAKDWRTWEARWGDPVFSSLSPLLAPPSGVTPGSRRLRPHLGHRSQSRSRSPGRATQIKQQMTEILNIGVCIQAGKINNTISQVAEQTFAHLQWKQ